MGRKCPTSPVQALNAQHLPEKGALPQGWAGAGEGSRRSLPGLLLRGLKGCTQLPKSLL